jgi:hypothetical protein
MDRRPSSIGTRIVWCLFLSSVAATPGASTSQAAPPGLPPGTSVEAPAFVLQIKPLRMEPFRESRLQLNPPTFRWPVEKGAAATYRIELARDRAFTNPRVELVRDLWFRPLEPLATGTWYWRCRVETPHPGAWLGTESFELRADLPTWPVPDWSQLVARIPADHPRVYVRANALPALRASARKLDARLQPRKDEIGQALAETFSLEPYVARAAQSAGAGEKGIPGPRLRIIESKMAAMAASTPAADGAWLWAATGDPALLAMVKRRALLVAGFDPAGFISERTSGADSANVDFGNSHIVHQLGVIYDLLYDQFTADERRQLRAAIVARAQPVFAKVARCSQELMRAHAWQHGFLDVLAGAVAVYGEEPDVAAWIESGVKAFVAFYPWFGGNDGGSQEGTRYFHGQEVLASLDTLDVFRHAFGLRLDEGNPWFRASPYFLIYSFPPGDAMARLGDTNGTYVRDHDDLQAPDGKSRIVAHRMAELFGNGHAAAYAAAAPEEGYGFGLSHLLRWMGETRVEPIALTTLPPARLFRDIGAVYVHSALARPDDNVRLVFHASPYGGHGHSHADQNSFHVIAYGEDLLLDSGYYPAFNNADPHRLKWSVQTKAHNSILVDGSGQSWGGTRGYGEIRHFEQHGDWVYMVGGAGHAYPDTPLDRFDRHVVWLRGREVQTYVIVDDLATAGGTARRFDWLLHAARPMAIEEATRRVTVRGERGTATITFLEPATLGFQQNDQFDAPAVSWSNGEKLPLPNQWHLKATPPRAASMRFVAVIQVGKPGMVPPAPRGTATVVETAGWRVTLPAAGARLSIAYPP